MDPLFLELDEVLEIQRDQVARYGGLAGVRDLGLLESALATPRASFGGKFLHSDLAEMAAAYLFHLVCNHPFLDGNKRTGAVAAIVFLHLNGIAFFANEQAFEKLVRGVAGGTVRKAAIAEFFRKQP